MTLTETTADSGAPTAVDETEARQARTTLIAVILGIVAWGLCFAVWGLPGLYLPAVALVPVVFGSFILICTGR
ncbi:hypothetical protein D6850_00320 [Roseovarius spongiae]|uniref:Uncharacterized protein n=1 Tax=Roseovarius spongiae TaxID=2320272 RepID=A0A3A8AWM7_9RHOB|nr:hypothetical protein [Roseovarius spongiae]RKF16056.1 hypothetical protein D6850_00320 [Roseovarius spongiae]